MTVRHPSRRAPAVPVGMAVAAAFTLLPGGAAAAADAAPVTSDAPTLSHVVNVRPGHAPSAKLRQAIADAGGTIVTSYDRIGVIVVRSADPGFARTVRKVRGVDSAGATRTAPLPSAATADPGTPHVLTAREVAAAKAADGQDPLQKYQWNLPAIKADRAHRKSLGSDEVTVAVLDTGVDDTHPDIAPNFDRAASVSCATGEPDTTEGAWRPGPAESPHGTHVAGEIAAARNGVGMTGVAPGVKVSGIKVSDPDGFFYTEAVVCGFVWAAEHGVEVTNNSYYTDPWYFNCEDDPDQRALVEAVSRASRYAEEKGAVNVAAAGNEKYDLAADAITDRLSPDDSTPAVRVIDPSECYDIPAQLPGVVTVAATGAKGVKSSFSNHGLGVVDIAAPGGDATAYQKPEPPADSGLILGTLPGGTWGYLAGTSMATPHVAGVAALIRSTHPQASPARVKALLYAGADAQACPEPYDYNADGEIDAVCEGSTYRNGFYGRGIADALDAVTR